MRRIVVVVLALVAALSVAACGGKGGQSAQQVQSALAPQVQKDEATGKAILNKCGVSTTTVTLAEVQKLRSPAGRKTVANCVVPRGHAAAFEACALNAVKSHISLAFFTPTNEARVIAALTKCAVVNR